MLRLRYAVALSAVAIVISPDVSQSAVANPWTGKWARPPAEIGGAAGGVTTLNQSGSSVTGSVNWGGGGGVTGQISGNTLTGTWTAAGGGSGTMTLTINADATSFTGHWLGTTDPFKGRSGDWTGTYIGTRGATPTQTTPASAPQKPVGSASHPLARLTVNQSGKVYFPHEATIKNGALVTVCNHNNFDAAPFSLSKYNEFPAGLAKMSNMQLIHAAALRPGKCMTLHARNPTKYPIGLKIYDAIHSNSRMVITVMPSP